MFNITTGAASAISFSMSPSNAVANTNITPAIVAHVQDAGGNPISGDGVTLTIANNAGGAGTVLTGGSSVNTDSNGNATFSGVSLNKVGSGYTLTATDSSGTPLTTTSGAFNITAGAASAISFTTQPSNTAAGASILADAQERDNLAEEHLIHCHTCLVELYEAAGDEYHEHLNRGLGLYQLACERATLPNPNGNCSVESLLMRSAGELLAARQRRHDEARACWYLSQIWSRLGQRQPATRWLRAAWAAAPFSELTPAETRRLHLAWERFEQEGRK